MKIHSRFHPTIITQVAGITIIAIALVTASSLVFQGKLLNSRAAEISAIADLATQAFQSNIDLYTQTAYGARGLLSQSDDEITRREFHRYVESLNTPRTMPGLSAVLVLNQVPNAEKNRFLTSTHKDESLDLVDASKFVIWPNTEKDLYLPVLYAEPANMSNVRGVLGFDYASEPIRLSAFEQAVQADEAIITQPVPSSVSKIQSLFLILPFFDYTKPSGTPLERQKAALGAVVLGFRSEKLFNSAFNLFLEHNPDLTVRVFDGANADPAKLIYNSDEGKKVLGIMFPAEKITQTRTIKSAGRTWTFEFSDYAVDTKASSRIPLLIMISFLVTISAIGGALLMKRPKQTVKT